jgi:hypothetical protein
VLKNFLYSKLLKTKPEYRQVYDCFIFFNELDLLELRLREMSGYIDKFVLVEATKTHQGNPKPLYFLDHRDRFRDFADKIIHVIVEDLPVSGDAMKNERFHRNCILRGLTGCAGHDVIIVSDVDEITRREAIDFYKDHHLRDIRKLDQKFFYYYLNYLSDAPWRLAFMAAYGALKDQDLGRLRNTKVSAKKILANAGWHFSYLGGIDSIIKKLEAFCHADLNTARYKDREWLEHCLQTGEDLFGRPNLHFQLVPIDDSFPRQIVNDTDYYRQLGWIK